jgi:hypothetical protein
MITNLVPFKLHYPAKKLLWGSQSKDTFPTTYKMNTQEALIQLFSRFGFDEGFFAYLDDCRTFGQYSAGLAFELNFRKLTKKLGVVYPENCLLGVYVKR